MSIRSILRNKVKQATRKPGNNRKDNRRMFAAAWQRNQVKKFGGIKEYILMRIRNKRRSEELDITLA